LKENSEFIPHMGIYKNAVDVAANANTGRSVNIFLFASVGIIVSLLISFIISASGWNHGGPFLF
jgi:uncharacterized protein YacL